MEFTHNGFSNHLSVGTLNNISDLTAKTGQYYSSMIQIGRPHWETRKRISTCSLSSKTLI